MRITVVGAGYVGLFTGLILASFGNEVYFVDVDEEKIERLKKGIVPFKEPYVQELLKKNLNESRVNFSTDYSSTIPSSKAIFICVGTPPKINGEADLRYLKDSVGNIIKNFGKVTKVIVIKSTVPVGTAKMIKRMIERGGHKNFDVVSNPEFLREGHALEDTVKPDRIVIGSESKKATDTLLKLYKPIIQQNFEQLIEDRLNKQVPVVVTSNKSAELIKYAANAFLTTKISFINEIANIAEKTGADITEIEKGIGLDVRIGKKFLKAGLGWGGSCFPKDTRALHQIAGSSGYIPILLKSVIEVNNEQRYRFLNKIVKNLGGDVDGKIIAILGLAFKAGTDDVRESPAIEIINKLIDLGARINVYDPLALENARKVLPASVNFCDNLESAVEKVDAMVITTESLEFSSIDFKKLNKLVKKKVIFDGRNIISKPSGWKYFGVGR